MTSAASPRLAILSYSNGRFDARARRIARSAQAQGYAVTIYSRWEWGLPLEESVDGARIIRVPTTIAMTVPLLRGRARRKVARIRAAAAVGAPHPGRAAARSDRPLSEKLKGAVRQPIPVAHRTVIRIGRKLKGTVLGPAFVALAERLRNLFGPFLLFPLRPMAWAAALDDVAEPADLWHGMWAGSLPALAALKGHHGGASLYDSRDIYTHARVFDRMNPLMRRWFQRRERGWVKGVDVVVTANDAYADILAPLLRVPRPVVVRNCPDPYETPAEPPDLIRRAAGLPRETAVILYQGGLLTDRGIEQGMEAIRLVPGAHLVLLGFGPKQAHYTEMAARPENRALATVLPAVPPEELLEWTASADVMLMAIQPTSLNHTYTTPQKLWEAISAGVPVVASDLPGMAQVVREVDCGVLCDPTDPVAIAAAIRELLVRNTDERSATSARMIAAARTTYNWHSQATVLLATYTRLLEDAH